MPYIFSHREYADMVFVYGFCNGNTVRSVEEYRRRFPNRRIPNRQVFQSVFTRAGESGMFPSASIVSEKQQGLSLEHEENILDVVENNPGISTRRMAIQSEIPQTMVWKTLKRQGLNAFHLQKVQNLQEGDYPLRLQFCQWIRENRRLLKCILFSDEAQFTRDGINNYHNNHRWSNENPHATQEHNFQHRFSINVWCGILNDQLFGPFVLDGRLTGEGYLHFLEDHLEEILDDVPLNIRQRMIFQHDGAPPHYSNNVRNFLNTHFGDRWIGRGGPHPWPPISPDLTPLDFCLWGWMKSLVYARKVDTRDALLDRILNAAAFIRANHRSLKLATRSIYKRANKCIEVGGGIFENVMRINATCFFGLLVS
ncbi:uncharacterized protein [Onthophagus taurus]|uniref:uncharacterized protein n=1 Tax=Onthophagus taurus TaxID=166361 RepID=UPI0039BEABC4